MEDHRSSKFPELTMSLFQQLKEVFKTETGQPFIFSGSGTGAWEAALTNTLSPGDKVLAPRFGQFSHLWIDLAQRVGLDVVVQRGMGDRRLARAHRGGIEGGSRAHDQCPSKWRQTL
jgi:alanine-glyoxylate transaminase / serine-glyoxylate transaminase / serine-pyruvate transaminase